jgi:hypothetical protein
VGAKLVVFFRSSIAMPSWILLLSNTSDTLATWRDYKPRHEVRNPIVENDSRVAVLLVLHIEPDK